MKTLLNISITFVLQKALCLLCLALICEHPLSAQDDPRGSPWESLQDSLQQYKEALVLRTDRDLYVVGEEVWMKVYKLNAHDNKYDNFSKVVYIEVLNQAGYPVNQLKVHLPNSSGSASLTLSDTLSSGNYLCLAVNTRSCKAYLH